MADVYQRIWNSDGNRFSVSVRSPAGEWDDRHADVLLDEQAHADPTFARDRAPKQLFARVNAAKLRSLPTFDRFVQLLDNYRVGIGQPELITRFEKREIEAFLESILATQPIAIAFEFIWDELNFALSWDSFAATLYHIWFQPYTNYFGGRALSSVSGFEHIFVGEGKLSGYNLQPYTEQPVGQISGYHSWVKFFLDEQDDRVNFLGYRFRCQVKPGHQHPIVVVLQMAWNQENSRGQPITLVKDQTSFFVGTSPECEIALGTVAFYESLRHRFQSNRRRIQINDVTYDLILYLRTDSDGTRGEAIHSFFPLIVHPRSASLSP